MKKMSQVLCLILALTISLVCLTACAKSWSCDWCNKKFSGAAYYDGSDASSTLCSECAISYFAPFSIDGYRKK